MENPNTITNLEDLPQEEWAPIPGYETFYLVSNLGRVKAMYRFVYSQRHRKEINYQARILKQIKLNDRYRVVNLAKEGKSSLRTVHSLVMESFVGPRPQGLLIAHWDDKGDNNRLSNLRYATPKENQADAKRNRLNTAS